VTLISTTAGSTRVAMAAGSRDADPWFDEAGGTVGSGARLPGAREISDELEEDRLTTRAAPAAPTTTPPATMIATTATVRPR
jgi:hypothetical protein